MRHFFNFTTGRVVAILFVLVPLNADAYTFTSYLDYGSFGPDVSALQQTLKDQGHFLYPTITDWFGPVTQETVQKFQCALNIVCNGSPESTGYGRVGPSTLNALNNLDTKTAAKTTTTASYTFTRGLGLGIQGEDVRELQKFLNTNGFLVAEIGAGSPGNETTYFGSATQAALANFQAKYGIVPAVGFFGSLTQAKIAELAKPTESSIQNASALDHPQSLKIEESRSYRIVLSWDVVDGATSYNIKRKGEDENGYSVIGTATTTTFTDMHVSSHLWYSYVVIALNAEGESSQSSVVAAYATSPGGGGGGSSSDTTAPTVSLITATNLSTTTQMIAWSTDEDSTTRVAYGLTSSYGSYTTLDSSLVTSHSVTISGLTASTTYHYAVISTDAAGNSVTSSDQTFTTNVYDYYVNSASGNDSNNGSKANLAFATLEPLSDIGTLSSGTKIGIAKDSTFTSQLSVSGDNITVEAYGSGAKPYIDARDVVSGFTATPGRTGVYQTVIVLPNNVKALGNVWENESILRQYTNLDDVEANSGSAYISDWAAATSTLYIHATDDGDPDSNGETYRYSRRLYSINIVGDNTTIRGMRTRGQAHQDGSIRIAGENGLVDDSRIEDGARHSLYFQGSGTVTDSYFYRGANWLESSANFIVWYKPDNTAIVASTSGNTYDQGDSTDIMSVFSSHGSGSDLSLSGSHTNETFINVNSLGNNYAQTVTVTSPILTNSGGFNFTNSGDVNITEIQPGSTFSERLADATTGGSGTLTVEGGSFAITSFNDGFIRGQSTSNDFDVELNNVVVDVQKSSDSSPRNFVNIKKGTLTLTNTTVGPTVGPIYDQFLQVGVGATGAIIADNNTYPYGAKWNLNGSTYYSLAHWQASSTEDSSSGYSTLTASISDDFNRADENLEDSATWTRVGGAASQAAIRSNELAFIGTTQTLYHVADQGETDEWVQYTLSTTTPAAAPIFAVIRATDESNFVGVRQNSSQYQLIKYLSGSFSQPSASSGVTPQEGDEVVISAYDNHFVVYVNKRIVASAIITDSILQTATKAGTVPRAGVVSPDALDNFSHGSI